LLRKPDSRIRMSACRCEGLTVHRPGDKLHVKEGMRNLDMEVGMPSGHERSAPRAIVCAHYSSDRQRDASIEDQVPCAAP
jgi:hypothetical protein